MGDGCASFRQTYPAYDPAPPQAMTLRCLRTTPESRNVRQRRLFGLTTWLFAKHPPLHEGLQRLHRELQLLHQSLHTLHKGLQQLHVGLQRLHRGLQSLQSGIKPQQRVVKGLQTLVKLRMTYE
jgi:X-X-X-Leu-X-X-Gly heptad repeat protein